MGIIRKQAIVIGAGTSGLSIAALLAGAGYKTLVLERQQFIGGRARIWHKDGFIVDYGIHTLRGNYQKVFHPLNMELHKVHLPISKGIILEDRGICHKLPQISSLFRANTLRLHDIGVLTRHLGHLFLKNPRQLFQISIKQWLDNIGASIQCKKVIKIASLILLVCPFLERASLGEFLFNLRQLNLTGLGHPKGGFRQVHRALVWKLRSYGGEIRLGCKVEQIEIKKQKAVGVQLENEEISADIVISSLPVQQLETLIDPAYLQENYRYKIRNLKPTAGISVDYGLSQKLYREIMFLTATPPIMGAFTSNIDKSTAPKHKQLVTFLYVLDNEVMENPSVVKKKSKLLEEKIFTLFPKFEDKIEWKRLLFLKMVDGVELNTQQTQITRPDVQVPGIEKLYIASDSTCAEGAGGDIAFSSARLCFDRIMRTIGKN
ncbi:MAG: phytoene desaturase family protein [Candidatus Helarchaeota archaeon]